jgi:acetyl esterase/lipase
VVSTRPRKVWYKRNNIYNNDLSRRLDGLPPPLAATEELDIDHDNDTTENDDGDSQNDEYSHVSTNPQPKKTEILVCHGLQDPVVSDQSLEGALATLTQNRHIVSLLQLQGAKHGFNNPAQVFNDNPAIAL